MGNGKDIDAGCKINNDAKHIREILEGAIRMAGIIHDRTYSFQLQCSPNDRFYKYSGNKERIKEKHIVPWGSVGMVLTNNKPSKFGLRGEPMLMIGYAVDHPSGTYRFYNPRTQSVVLSNNIRWTEWKQWEVDHDDFNKLLDVGDSGSKENHNLSNNPYSALFESKDSEDDVEEINDKDTL
jgi:hypothetical protein